MGRNKRWVLGLGLVGLLAFTGTAQALLIDQLDGTVKDDTTNLIWLQNWNVNGFRDWGLQVAWADGLDFAGSTDWRLPSIDEYVGLFTEYGDLTQVAEFTRVQDNFYWSGTEVSSVDAWDFSPDNGFRVDGAKDISRLAVAVRPGDVAAVPEPGTLALFGMGLLGLLGLGRARRPLRLRFFD